MKEDWLSNGDENLKTKEMLLSQFKCETAYEAHKLLINYLNNVSDIDNLLYNRIKDNLFLPLDSSLS